MERACPRTTRKPNDCCKLPSMEAGAIGGKNASENSFGLIALCSVGPIIALMGLVIASKGTMTYELSKASYSIDASLGENFIPTVLNVAREVLIALGLIVVFFMALQIIALRPYPTVVFGRHKSEAFGQLVPLGSTCRHAHTCGSKMSKS